eukprot:6333920-Amphidinium_carterae.1
MKPDLAPQLDAAVQESECKEIVEEDCAASRAPALWTASWAELCRSKLEALGYPAQREVWGGKGRRRCKFAFRLFRIVADCVRSLQRAQLSRDEATAWQKLVELLSHSKSV